MKLLVAIIVAVAALLVAVPTQAETHPAHWTDGTTFDSSTNFGPPPIPPHFAKKCKTDVIDPSSFVFVTEHVVYGTKPPKAGVVPVVDDASAVFNYVGSVPGTFKVDIENLVAGKRGFRADTWNIGTGVTKWVEFNCTTPATTTTTSTSTSTSTTSTSTTTVPVSPPVPVAPPAPSVPTQPQFTG